jgi:arsenate reductase
MKNVLFLCTGNSARSILAEAILSKIGKGRFTAFSAGSQPKPAVHPETLRLLKAKGYETGGLHSKSWNEFARGEAQFDHIVTVCNNAAGEACPIIPGQPAKDHWDIPDPAAATGSHKQIEMAFESAYAMLTECITAFVERHGA